MKRYDDLSIEIVPFVAMDILTMSNENDKDNINGDIEDWN